MIDWKLDVFVPGQARPQGSKDSLGRGRMVESSKYVGPWRERVAFFAVQASVGQRPIPRDVPVITHIAFVLPRPASLPKRSTPAMIKQPDLDKLLRAVCDALTGIAWVDDAQVVLGTQSKRYAELDETHGARIRVGTLGIADWSQISALGFEGLAHHTGDAA